MKNVLITTKYRGVWFAQVDEGKDLTEKTLTDLKNCRMCIYWNTKGGLHELADVGPNSGSRIGNSCNIKVLHYITAVFDATDDAAEKFMSWSK